MREVHQAVWGILAAILSSLLVFGGLAISLAETRPGIAMAPTSTLSVPTQAPGQPTYTASPTSLPTSTPTIVFPNACDYPAGWVEITVGVGDTLYAIAGRYQVSVDDLRRGNCLEFDGLMAGMNIHVPPHATDTFVPSETAVIAPTLIPTTKPQVSCLRPPGWVIYYVKPGDTLYRIGLAVGIPYQQLQYRNCLNNYTIYPGQRLYVPRLPVFLVTPTPLPYLSPTPPLPVSSPTLIVPTNVPPTPIPPSMTPIVNTATPGLPTVTPIPPTLTQVAPSATWTNTPLPTVTQTPLPTDVPTETPEPDTPTPLPSATETSIPLPTRTPVLTIVLTPRITPIPPTPPR